MKKPNKARRFLKEAKIWVVKNRATLMSVGAAAGVVAGGVMASRAGAKAQRDILAFEKENGREATKGEKAKIILKDHVAPIGVGMATVGLIFGADDVNRRTIGALSGLYAAAVSKYDSIIKQAGDKLTPEEKEQMVVEVLKDEYKERGIVAKPGEELWYEEHIGYFTATEGDVYKCICNLNDELDRTSMVTFAEFAMEAAHISVDDISPEWWTMGWSYETMEAAWAEDKIRIVPSKTIIDEDLVCTLIQFVPYVFSDVCTKEGDLIYWVTSPMK